jgi:hypothetical protein
MFRTEYEGATLREHLGAAGKLTDAGAGLPDLPAAGRRVRTDPG